MGMAEKRTKADKWQRNAERLEEHEDARRESEINYQRSEPTSGITDAKTLEEQIRLRAYEFFEARGREHGHDHEDWLQAEAEIRAARRQAPAASGRVIPFPLSTT